ncbi:MAG: hypothetical protein HS129_09505 [Leptospiraceae bacterium]|nr:hypothetical protein [Leptospiraceae bacterium]NUM40840.1 hypothetical protein [Leptospiraceae bacterium]
MSILKKSLYYFLIYALFMSIQVGQIYSDEVKPSDESKTDSLGPTIIKNLSVRILPNLKSVRLDWEAPAEEGDVIIARSSSIIDSLEKLHVADSLGKYPSNKKDGITSFTDYNLRTGKYFYAVVLASDVRKGRVTFHPDNNYISKPIVIDRPVENNDNISSEANEKNPQKNEAVDYQIRALTIIQEGQFLRLKWEPPLNADSLSPKYTIYRSTEPLSSFAEINRADQIVEVNHPDITFLDQDLHKSETLYYGVSVTVNGKETLPLIGNRSFLRVFYVKDRGKASDPVVVDTITESKKEETQKREIEEEKKREKEEAEKQDPRKSDKIGKKDYTYSPNDLYEILKNSYWKKKYGLAVYWLNQYIEKETEIFSKGKAIFYIGLSYYRTGNYREALNSFLKEEAKIYNEERVNFYIKRCLEVLGAGK